MLTVLTKTPSAPSQRKVRPRSTAISKPARMAAGRVAIERSLSVARAVASPKIRFSAGYQGFGYYIDRRRDAVGKKQACAGSLQIVHALGGGQRPRAAGAIPLCIEALGACQGGSERRLRLPLGALDRGGRRLAIELCADRLRRHRLGVRISRGLAHGLLELRDLAGAGTGLRRPDAQSQGGDYDRGYGRAAGSCGHHGLPPRSAVWRQLATRTQRCASSHSSC